AIWIYTSYSYMTIGNKVGEPNSWMAWVPVLNYYYMVKLARLSGWFTLIFLTVVIPFLGALIIVIFVVYLSMQIAKRRGFDEWLGLLTLVPIANLVLPGYLAFAEPTKKATSESPGDMKKSMDMAEEEGEEEMEE
ncbi:hypothetical protein KC622_01420, partial [Candidatus Dojkabacteria bacterium]|nr:hypothetical protein [Candidatus Dojkabacteria bacterium]